MHDRVESKSVYTRAYSRLTVLAALITFAAAMYFVGCGMLVDDCPEPTNEPIEAGTYEHTTVRGEVSQLLHGVLESPTLQIDRDRGIVEVSYERNGERVVETWAIKDARFEDD